MLRIGALTCFLGVCLCWIGVCATDRTTSVQTTSTSEQFPPEASCSAGASEFPDPLSGPHWVGWGANLAQQRFQSAAMAQLDAEHLPMLTLKWAFGFPGVLRAYGQPTVAAGRVFVGTEARKVYSLDAATGCIHWIFDVDFPVRTAISIGPIGDDWAAYFGDQHANAYAVDAVTGKLIWKRSVDDHRAAIITGAPTLAAGRLFVPTSSTEEVLGGNPQYECCKFRGSVSALDAATGHVLWKAFTIPEEPRPVHKNRVGVQLWGPSGAAVWSSPTVDLDKRVVYVATGDSYSDPAAPTSDAFLAFDLDTGRLLWSRQMTPNDAFNVDCESPAEKRVNCPVPDPLDADFGSSPILVQLPNGRRALIAGQKSGMVYAADPDKRGEIIWQRRVGNGGRMGGVVWGSAADADNVYVAVSDAAKRGVSASLPPRAAGSSSGSNFQLDPKIGGGLFALRLGSGDVAWHTPHPGCGERANCSPAQSAAVTVIPGIAFSGSIDGHLRAYAATNGHIVWDVDTETEFKTVNGVKAHGGSLDGPGPVIAGGMLYVNSGYAFSGGVSGNVLLAFSVNGK